MYPQGISVTGEEKNIELLTLGVCPSTVAIAIGSGGRSEFGSGGSGYVEYTTNWSQKAYLKMKVYPGSPNYDSSVIDISDSRDIVRGEKGQDGGSFNGGAGEKIKPIYTISREMRGRT